MKTKARTFFFLILLVSASYQLFAFPQGERGSGSGEASQKLASGISTGESQEELFKKMGMTVFSSPQKIPSFTVKGLTGEDIRLADYTGKYVFLNFWATWCPPCRQEMPSMERLARHVAGDDLVMLAVSIGEDQGTVAGFLEQNPYTFTIGINEEGNLGQMYAGRGIPTTYILDREGRVIAGKIGGYAWDSPESIEAFAALLRK